MDVERIIDRINSHKTGRDLFLNEITRITDHDPDVVSAVKTFIMQENMMDSKLIKLI